MPSASSAASMSPSVSGGSLADRLRLTVGMRLGDALGAAQRPAAIGIVPGIADGMTDQRYSARDDKRASAYIGRGCRARSVDGSGWWRLGRRSGVRKERMMAG